MAINANGGNRTKFCNALAVGIVKSIKGKAFATVDVGLVPSAPAGIGTGIGVVGLQSDHMVQMAMAVMPTTGVHAEKTFKAIMDATVTHLLTAALNSTHVPVFVGTGTVVVGSIPVTIEEMASNIDQALKDAGANGGNRTIYCKALSTGIVNEILQTGTGQVVIVGPGSPIPSTGTGAGVGVIS